MLYFGMKATEWVCIVDVIMCATFMFVGICINQSFAQMEPYRMSKSLMEVED